MCTAKHFKYLSLFIVHLTAGGNYRFFKNGWCGATLLLFRLYGGILNLLDLFFQATLT